MEEDFKRTKGIKMRKLMNDYKLLFRRMFLAAFDVVAVFASGIAALLLRFDFSYGKINESFLDSMFEYLPYNIIITILIFWLFRLYHSVWEFAGVVELQNIVSGCVCTSLIQLIIFLIFDLSVPRSYYFTFGFILFMLTLLSRFAYRYIRMIRRKNFLEKKGKNAMIIGGGEAGSMIIKEIVTSEHLFYQAKCVIDDDENKIGRFIQGVKVVGNRDKIKEYVISMNIHLIIIAMPAVSRMQRKEIIELCQSTNCEIKILPGIYQLMNGEINVSKLRDVEIEDLLGRESVRTDLDVVMNYVGGKCVLVTGGGGSIGSELCRQISEYKPKRLIILEIYENNAYDIQQELKKNYPELDLVVMIASVRNTARINSIMKTYRPQIIYHAAAHKHVPLMEDSPGEAIKNNVFGTLKTVQAADAFGVERFVLVSTDKAVNPTNVMGATKRICEMILQCYNRRSKTEFVAVRFGNVLGSNGSVIPLFKKQIEMGGPVTVTHPDIIRYFMTIPEAVSLVLQAGASAKGGEIFVLDMGEPVKIDDLAKNLIRLSGYLPNEDIEIKYVGLRPGEKLYEELLMEEEGLMETENEMIHIGQPIPMEDDLFLSNLEELKKVVDMKPSVIRKALKRIVPTYHKM